MSAYNFVRDGWNFPIFLFNAQRILLVNVV